jgi:hypothetical protein
MGYVGLLEAGVGRWSREDGGTRGSVVWHLNAFFLFLGAVGLGCFFFCRYFLQVFFYGFPLCVCCVYTYI